MKEIKYWKLREWVRFFARLLYLPHVLLEEFISMDHFPSKNALKKYLLEDYFRGKYLAERKAGW